MAYVIPKYSKSQINRAGDILLQPSMFSARDRSWADSVLANWRASHGYPMNTFQATLRAKLKNGYGNAIVAQRLKRGPSILLKLRRFSGMKLARMQDIGGLRAVVTSIERVRRLERNYRNSSFGHELIGSKDYIEEPKDDGYRSVHLIYRYNNPNASEYSGLSLELQIRTELQHAWATAVETMGTFLGQALKSGQGDEQWKEFFVLASAAITFKEGTTVLPAFCNQDERDVIERLFHKEQELNVCSKLQGFALAADRIVAERGQGAYHLIVLDSEKRTLSIRPYPKRALQLANEDYADIERRTENGEAIEAVLVAAGPVSALRRAYPNYFLDTQLFIREIYRMFSSIEKRRPNKRLQRTALRRRR